MAKKNFLEQYSYSVLLILLVAAGLRLWGIGFGLPDLFHADEPIVVNHALQFGSGDLNPHFFNIPPLTSYLLFGIYGFLYFIGKIFQFWSDPTHFAEHFFRDPSIFYLIGRIALGVTPAVASVYLLMMWMKRLDYSKVWVSAAGLLFAVCFVHVSDAHYIYADMPLILACLMFFYALCQFDQTKKSTHFKLGLLIGLATAFKYNGIFLVAPYLFMHVRHIKKPLDLFILSFIAAAGTVLAFVILNPYAILDGFFFIHELREQSAANQGVPFLHHLTYSLAEGISWPLLLLSLAGAVRAFFSKDVRLQCVSLFCFMYYLVLWQKGQPYGRYILPLVPFLILLAIHAAQLFSQKNKWLRVILMTILFCSGILNLTKAIRFDWIMQQPDVRTEASQWIEKNIPSGSRIALDGTSFTPRLSFSCEQLQEKLSHSTNLQRIQSRLRTCEKIPTFNLFYLVNSLGANPFLFASPEILRNIDELKKNRIQYVLFIPENHSPVDRDNYRRQMGKLIRAWEPRTHQSSELEIYDPQIITGGPFTWKDLWARTANGYRIELYDMGTKT